MAVKVVGLLDCLGGGPYSQGYRTNVILVEDIGRALLAPLAG